VATFTPLLGAEIVLEPRATVTFAVDPGFEHGLLVDHGDVRMADTLLRPAELGYAQPGATALTLTNESDGPARTVLLGGTPFEEQIVMWWNFIGRSHEDIVRAREDWANASDRFGAVEGYPGDRLPAPVLPNAVITPRGNPPRRRPAPEGHPMTESPASPAAATVERNDARHRYEILVDGKRAGLTAYRDRGEQRVFFHTEVDDAFAGQGLAAQLVQYALTDVRDLGMRIVPVCPYVAKFLKKHDEFADITEPVTPEVLAWLDAELG
jgi:predicted GNAT family acetyltransferase